MQPEKSELLRMIPSVNQLLEYVQDMTYSRQLLLRQIRRYLDDLRAKILKGERIPEVQENQIHPEILKSELLKYISANAIPKICRAINGTGVILHTGLGRAVLPSKAISTLCDELRGYSVVEVDRESGERSVRDIAVKDLLCGLTKAENATVVNNNAGAVLLVLASLAKGKEVIVSRGQLVEIGGSFRVPEVMAESGASLVEVGCTNRTHIFDYEKAISDKTAAILHVHTSNFKVYGFTHEVCLEELVALTKKKGILMIEDAGSGAMMDFSSYGLKGDPIIPDSISKGADIVTFSGDKLLGSCQAGIIVGKKNLVEKIKKHPLARALRVDKITLSILESSLKLYYNPDVTESIPVLKMIKAKPGEIKERAEKIAEILRQDITEGEIFVKPSMALAGSGSFPTLNIPSYGVFLKLKMPCIQLARMLRLHSPPVFTHIQDDFIVIDPRTLLPGEDLEIADIIKKTVTNFVY